MFEGLKKKSILKKIQNKEYQSFKEATRDIKEKLGTDEECYDLAVLAYEDSFKDMELDKIIEYLLKYPEIDIKRVDSNMIQPLILKEPSLAKKLDRIEILNRLYNARYEINQDERDKFFDIIFEELNEEDKYDAFCHVSYCRNQKYLEKYPKFVLRYLIEAKNSDYRNYAYRRETYAEMFQMNNLPVALSLAILKMDLDFFKYLSPESKKAFIKDNPYIYDFLKEKEKTEDRETPRSLEKRVSYDIPLICFDKGYAIGYFLHEQKRDEEISKLGEDFYKNLLINIPSIYYGPCMDLVVDYAKLVDYDIKKTKELALYDPRILYMNTTNGRDLSQKEFRVKVFKSVTDGFPDKEEFDKLYEEILHMDYGYDATKNLRVYIKVILNPRIMSKASHETILKYLKEQTHTNLYNLIKEAYGDASADIIKLRTELTADDIPTFDIFDSKIIDNFGPGVVHMLLSYESNAGILFGELSRNEEMLNRFVYYKKQMETVIPFNQVNLERLSIAFYELESLGITINEFTQEELENYYLYVNDKYLGSLRPDNRIGITCKEDIRDYKVTRNQMFDDAIEILTDKVQIRDIIFQRYFGMKYDTDTSFYKNTLDISQILKAYNAVKFANSKTTKEKNLFTEEELDMLRLLEVIENIQNVDKLKAVYKSLATANILNFYDFREIITKMDRAYSESLIENITSINDFDKMIDEKRTGISKKTLEDVPVYTLSGVKFRMLVHNPATNNSELNPSAMDTIASWNTLENGCSVISCCYIDQATSDQYLVGHDIKLGFTDISPEQIAGMGPVDIHSSHVKKDDNPGMLYGKVSYEYPDELLRRTAAMIEDTLGENFDTVHDYNEVALYRRHQNSSNIPAVSTGGRIMPDYLVCYIPYDSKKAIELAKVLSKNGKPIPIIELDTKVYKKMYDRGQRAYEGYKEDGLEVEDSRTIESIKNITVEEEVLTPEEELEKVGRGL